ncbi:MAG: nucleotidyltransferase family protein [Acidobacteriota bacterium]|nr:nucleotidyltransferase family protein [Acidobacteriota bacterium]
MDIDAAFRLLLLVRQEQTNATGLRSGQWTAPLELARDVDVLGLAARRVLDAAEAGTPWRAELQAYLARLARHHGFFFIEAQRVSDALAARSIPAVVLKGVGLARTLYVKPEDRSFRDLDLLVPPEALDEALACAEGLGYSRLRPELDALYRRHHFHLILEGPGRPRLELHWALARPDALYTVDPALLLESPDHGPGFPVPRPEAQALHCVLNLMRSGFTELKRLVDLDRLARRPAGLDLEWLEAQCRRAGLDRARRLAFWMCRELLDTPLPSPPARELHPLPRLGVAGFPLGLPPAGRPLAPQAVRLFLTEHKARWACEVLLRPRFERHRLAAMGKGPAHRGLAMAKRLLRALQLAPWMLGLVDRSHHRRLLALTTSLRSSSGPREADRDGIPERSSSASP